MSEVSEGGKGKVSPGDILEGRLTNDMGQPLAAHFRVLAHGNPFAFNEQLIGTMKAMRNGYRPVFKFDTLPVTLGVGGINFFNSEVAGLGNDHIEHFAIEVLVFFSL